MWCEVSCVIAGDLLPELSESLCGCPLKAFGVWGKLPLCRVWASNAASHAAFACAMLLAHVMLCYARFCYVPIHTHIYIYTYIYIHIHVHT